MVSDGDLLDHPTAEVGDAAFNHRSEFGGNDLKSGESILVQRESPTEVPKHWRRILTDHIEQELLRGLQEFYDRAAPFYTDTDARRFKGRLLNPGDQQAC